MKAPRLVEWFVRGMLPRGTRGDHVFGDLREDFANEERRLGRRAAARRMAFRALEIRRHLGWRRLDARPGMRLKREGAMGLDAWLRDLGRAGRALRRSPGFVLTTAGTMALGLGVFISVLVVLQAVLLAPAPFRDPDALVALRVVDTDTGPDTNDDSYLLSYPQFEDFRDRSRSFTGLVGWRTDTPVLDLGDGLPPIRVSAAGVTGDFFEVAGIETALGRPIQPQDEAANAPPVAVISYSLWLNRFGADPSVLGRTLSLNGTPFEVVGVVSDRFTGIPDVGTLPSTDTQLWMPHANTWLSDGATVRGLHNFAVLARTAAGVLNPLLAEDLDDVSAQLAREYEAHTDERVIAIPVQELLTGDTRAPILLLLFGCGIVLLLAMMNVTALTLARASGRASEMAVRQALGGGWIARARVLVAESIWIGGGGVALGAALAMLLLEAARMNDAGLLPRLEQSELDLGSLVVLGAIGLLSSLSIGMIPALLSRRTADTLRSARGTTAGGQRFRTALVVIQMAGTVVLLSASGLVLRSISELRSEDLGFDPTGVLSVDLRMPTPFVSPEWPRHVEFFRALTDELELDPAIASVGIAYQAPTDGGWSNGFTFSDRPPPPDGNGPSAIFRPVGPGYFETLGIPVLSGRGVERQDGSEAAGIVVVNESFVRAFFAPGDRVLGTRLDYGDFWGARPPEYEIVGVVRNVRFNGPETPTSPAVYFPHAQQPVHAMTVFARSAGNPVDLVPIVEAAVGRLAPGLPLDQVTTVQASVDERLGPRRFLATVLTSLAVIGILLALVGLYGVLSYGVEMRRREIGIRLALGADPLSVLGEILRRTLLVVTGGLILGAGISHFSIELVRRFLFGVSAFDPVAWGSAVVALAILGVATGMMPARRAVRIDPVEALRTES